MLRFFAIHREKPELAGFAKGFRLSIAGVHVVSCGLDRPQAKGGAALPRSRFAALTLCSCGPGGMRGCRLDHPQGNTFLRFCGMQ